MDIIIVHQVLSGNMGDGLADGAANAYSAFEAEALTERAKELYPEADIFVDTDIQNASGASRDVQVYVSDVDAETAIDAERSLINDLTYVSHYTWDDWCESDQAREYFDEN